MGVGGWGEGGEEVEDDDEEVHSDDYDEFGLCSTSKFLFDKLF